MMQDFGCGKSLVFNPKKSDFAQKKGKEKRKEKKVCLRRIVNRKEN